MKKAIIFLLVFISSHSFAQQPFHHIPTQFDKFIEQPGIDWATYISDTVRFPKLNLHELLRSKLDHDQIKATIWLFSRSTRANEIEYVDRKTIKRCNMCVLPAYSDSFDYAKYIQEVEDTSCRKFNSLDSNLIGLTEILYIEQGALKSYIPWISPQTAVYTSSDSLLGIGDYFSTSFNYKYDFKPAKNDSITYLGKTQRLLYVDSFQSRDRLKELYGRNLAEVLWTYALDDKLNIFSIKTNKKLKPDELDRNMLDDNPLMFPVLDTLGNTIGTKVRALGSVLEYIKKIEIVQQWYYDETRNIVYNAIPEVILFSLNVWYERSGKEWQVKSDFKPMLKIVF